MGSDVSWWSRGGQQAVLGVGTPLGGDLLAIMEAQSIAPGGEPDYELCKLIFLSHPLGSKMTKWPIELAQSQKREITVPDSPEDEVLEAFDKEWEALDFSRLILNEGMQGRMYGIASAAVLDGEEDTSKPLDLENLWKREVTFNVFDPLNTAGSLVTSQDPNSPMYQKWGDLSVAGTRYHRSRTSWFMNEESLYIAWTVSAFGFVGRSVYQRALYPMKSFLQSMVTDDMVTRKAGLIVARMDQAGSIVDRVMQAMWGVKRNLLKEAQTNNVISIGINEIVDTLNMRNVNDSMRESRENILKNIATAADMPAKLLTMESFVEGFGEGTQDAYAVAQYIDGLRTELRPLYRWGDEITQRRAWNPDFYAGIQRKYPDYRNVSYEAAFSRWQRSFKAVWPSLIKEPPSEAVGVEDTKMKAVIAYVQVMGPMLDPENQASLIQWAVDQVNVNEQLFSGGKFLFNDASLVDFLQEKLEQSQSIMGEEQGLEQAEGDPEKPNRPFSSHDAVHHIGRIIHMVREGEATPLRAALGVAGHR